MMVTLEFSGAGTTGSAAAAAATAANGNSSSHKIDEYMVFPYVLDEAPEFFVCAAEPPAAMLNCAGPACKFGKNHKTCMNRSRRGSRHEFAM
jgi:hypothetical protein